MAEGWIKLHRSLIDWEWYDDIPATRLLVHLLITVNYKEKKWKGVTVQPGQLIVSWDKLSAKTGLSVRQCRTAMKKLISSNEVTREVTSKYQVVTLVKWDKLQSKEILGDSKSASNKSVERQVNDKQTTTTKESNNIRNKEDNKSLKKYTKKRFQKNVFGFRSSRRAYR